MTRANRGSRGDGHSSRDDGDRHRHRRHNHRPARDETRVHRNVGGRTRDREEDRARSSRPGHHSRRHHRDRSPLRENRENRGAWTGSSGYARDERSGRGHKRLRDEEENDSGRRRGCGRDARRLRRSGSLSSSNESIHRVGRNGGSSSSSSSESPRRGRIRNRHGSNLDRRHYHRSMSPEPSTSVTEHLVTEISAPYNDGKGGVAILPLPPPPGLSHRRHTQNSNSNHHIRNRNDSDGDSNDDSGLGGQGGRGRNSRLGRRGRDDKRGGGHAVDSTFKASASLGGRDSMGVVEQNLGEVPDTALPPLPPPHYCRAPAWPRGMSGPLHVNRLQSGSNQQQRYQQQRQGLAHARGAPQNFFRFPANSDSSCMNSDGMSGSVNAITASGKPAREQSCSLSSSLSREGSVDVMEAILETAEQARERRRKQLHEQLAAGVLGVGITGLVHSGGEGFVGVGVLKPAHDDEDGDGQDIHSAVDFANPSTLTTGTDALHAAGRYAALTEVQKRRVQYQAMKGLLSADSAPASLEHATVRVALYGVDLSVTEDHLESMAAQLLGEAPWRVRRPVRELLLHNTTHKVDDKSGGDQDGEAKNESKSLFTGHDARPSAEGYLDGDERSASEAPLLDSEGTAQEQQQQQQQQANSSSALAAGAKPRADVGILGATAADDGLLGESVGDLLRRTAIDEPIVSSSNASHGATTAMANAPLLSPSPVSSASSFLFLPGLYDPNGPGGMVVMEFQRATTAKEAVRLLNGSHINGRYVRASLVADSSATATSAVSAE